MTIEQWNPSVEEIDRGLHMMSLSLKWITLHGLASFCWNLSWNISNKPENKGRQMFFSLRTKAHEMQPTCLNNFCTSVRKQVRRRSPFKLPQLLFRGLSVIRNPTSIKFSWTFGFLASFTEGSSNISGSNKWHLSRISRFLSVFYASKDCGKEFILAIFVEILSALRCGNLPKKRTVLRFLPEAAHVWR